MLASRVLRFGAFTLDLSRAILLEGDKQLPLRRQSFEVLRHLVEHAGDVVSADELIEAVWTTKPALPEHSVVQCIRDIRRALGEDARWIIRTVSGRGYQFMAEMTSAEAEPPPALQQGSGAPQIEATPAAPQNRLHRYAGPLRWPRALVVAGLLITVVAGGAWLAWQWTRHQPMSGLTMMAVPTLAVLPIKATQADAVEGDIARILASDLTAEILRNNLGAMISLKSAVNHRGDTADPKVIGQRFGARYLFMLSVRGKGEQHSGTATLVEAETGHRLWARSFQYSTLEERRYTVAQFANTVAFSVVTAERQRSLPVRPEAGHYAMLAFAAMNSFQKAGAQEEALALAERALDLDPNWVMALQTYVWAQVSLSRQDPPPLRSTRLDKARAAAELAIKLAPLDAAVYHRYGQVLQARQDAAGALAANQMAVRLNPNLAIAHAEVGLHKIGVGLARETIAHVQEAIRLSPGHRWLSAWCTWAGQAAVHTGNYDEAVRWLQKGMHASFPYWALKPWLAVALAGVDREEEGRALIAQHLSEGKSLTIAGWRKDHPRGSGVLAEQRERIERLLRQLGVPEGEVQAGSVD